MTTVSVHITRWDLARLSVFALPRHASFRWVLAALAAFIVIQLSMTRKTPASGIEYGAIALTAVIFVLGAAVLMFLLNLVVIVLASRESNGVLGLHEYQVREDGLMEITSANETLTKWGGATALHRSSNFVYIQVAPGLFHLFPRRCFPSDESMELFWKSIQRLVPNKSLERTREA